jgi:hypothetical protein
MLHRVLALGTICSVSSSHNSRHGANTTTCEAAATEQYADHWQSQHSPVPVAHMRRRRAARLDRQTSWDPNSLEAVNSFDGMQAKLDAIRHLHCDGRTQSLSNATVTIVALEPRIIVIDDFMTSAEADHLILTRSGEALLANTVTVDTGRKIGLFATRCDRRESVYNSAFYYQQQPSQYLSETLIKASTCTA